MFNIVYQMISTLEEIQLKMKFAKFYCIVTIAII